MPPPADLSKPGEVVYYDFRPVNPPHKSQYDATSALRVATWNIERAYKLDSIISLLQYHSFDLICLQELDVHNARSGWRDSVKEIALSLGMCIAFVCEFEELFDAKVRNRWTQGGGVHGNAILSKWPLKDLEAIEHEEAFKWEEKGGTIGEPRRGRRYTIACTVEIPTWERAPIRLYSSHLELFCGIRKRVRQFEDVLTNSLKQTSVNGERKSSFSFPTVERQLFFGDFNTLAHGVARFFPRFCQDALRFNSLGMSEAEWWHRNIFSHPDRCNYFYDPFDRQQDFTLWKARGWFFRGKLDWTLVRGMRVKTKGMDNLDFRASDHRLLWLELEDYFAENGEGDAIPNITAAEACFWENVDRELTVRTKKNITKLCLTSIFISLLLYAYLIR